MPTGQRYRIKANGVSYDFSKEQFDMLSRRVVRFPTRITWNMEQRMRGLTKKRLFIQRAGKKGAFERTDLGREILNLFKARTKKAVTTKE